MSDRTSIRLAGQAKAIQHALAARHLTRFAGCLAGAGSLDNLAAQNFGVVGPFFQKLGQ